MGPEILTALRAGLIPLSQQLESDLEVSSEWRRAAVLILLFPLDAQVTFLLTARPATMRRHPGQISLPGGAADWRDATLWHTAEREAREELGLRTGRMQPLGRLETVYVSASGYMIVPFVAWNPVSPRIRAEPHEVAQVIEVRLSQLLDPSSIVTERWQLRGQFWQVTFFRFGDHVVWGATARILSGLAMTLNPEHSEVAAAGSVVPA